MPKTSDTEYLSFPILLGDIGGTNARFSILIDSFAEPVHLTTVKTAEYPTIDDAIQQAVLDKTSLQPVSTILAIAGPIEGDEIPLTNCHWVVKPKDMLAKLGLKDVIVINDFEAQALAIAALDDDNRDSIGSGKRHAGIARRSRTRHRPWRCRSGLRPAYVVSSAWRRRPHRYRPQKRA